MIEPPDHIPDLRRLRVFYAAVVLFMVVIVVRLYYLQIYHGPELATQANTQRMRLIRKPAARGSILDARGRLLATNRPQFVIAVIPEELKKNPQVSPRLAQMLGLTEPELEARIQERMKKDRLVVSDPVPIVVDATTELLSQFEEQKVDLPGVLVSKDPVRVYVDNKLCTHVLGVVRPITQDDLKDFKEVGRDDYHGGDMIGKEGLEKTYESDLRGVDGGQMITVNAHGRLMRSLEETRPTPGHTLRLTIDLDLQRAAYDALQDPLAAGHPGAAVAMDPNDGAILAMVSTPSYDLNQFLSGFNARLADPLKPMVNRVTNSHYPSGSTFKLVTAAAGLETGAIGTDTVFYCPGSLRLGNHTFHCDGYHGALSFQTAIAKSCDVYFWRVAQAVGQEELGKWAQRFGLGQKTGIDLPSGVDSPGIVPSPAWKKAHHRGPWVPGDLLTMAIGQGDIGVTPLQLVDYTAALANGGSLLRPRLVREVLDISGEKPVVLRTLQREERGQLGLHEENRRAIIGGMIRVLEPGGTAYGDGIPGLSIAAKTGSAETYWKGKKVTHSVFVCFAPVEQPKIAIAVLVEDAGHGADVAGPIARRMLLQYFGIHDAAKTPPAGYRSGGD
ncbi:MAG TPA: penicillin-binding protein 2 [Chthonomonadaceae bacterium]|nr:penicillin-binding protein 2 [Chthonomonadaceae bacterium]